MIPETAQAQEEGSKNPVAHEQVFSANPFLLLYEWWNVEFERKISPKSTVGIIGSRVLFEDDDGDGDITYNSLNGFFRYYPQGAALSGFYFGGRLGIHQGSDEFDEGHAYGLGVDIGYSWLLGSNRNFYIGLGIGASRLFGGDLEEDRVVIPSIRLINVGFAF